MACCQRTPLRNELVARDPSLLDRVTEQVVYGLGQRFGGGPVFGKIQGHLIVVTKRSKSAEAVDLLCVRDEQDHFLKGVAVIFGADF